MSGRFSEETVYGITPILITMLLFVLTAFFGYMLYSSDDERGSLAFCLLGSGVLTVFWPLIPKIDNLKIGPAGVELTKKVDEANAKADDAASKAYDALAKITRFVFNSMPQPTFRNLEKIDSRHFGSFTMTDGFRQELRTLRDSGYVATNGYIAQIPAEGRDLSDFVYTTDLGKEFIRQRRKAESDAAVVASPAVS